ncbi:MAG: hypothetical protein DYH06_06950 [Acidobacteria bacterium ACB2]|nr:hypothetical protein [Acidobacteria bacterium ACB2]
MTVEFRAGYLRKDGSAVTVNNGMTETEDTSTTGLTEVSVVSGAEGEWLSQNLHHEFGHVIRAFYLGPPTQAELDKDDDRQRGRIYDMTTRLGRPRNEGAARAVAVCNVDGGCRFEIQ